MLYILLGIFSLILSAYMFKSFRVNQNNFSIQEAKRYFLKRNESNKSWHSNGRVYTNGIALIQNNKTKQKRFIKQSELCDIGILS